jgi:hypothetical protein
MATMLPDNMRPLSSVGLNGNSFFNPMTVKEDGAVDVLTGGAGMNWFWAKVGLRLIAELNSGEQVN